MSPSKLCIQDFQINELSFRVLRASCFIHMGISFFFFFFLSFSLFVMQPKTSIAQVKLHRLAMAHNRIGAFFVQSFPFLFSRLKSSKLRAILLSLYWV